MPLAGRSREPYLRGQSNMTLPTPLWPRPYLERPVRKRLFILDYESIVDNRGVGPHRRFRQRVPLDDIELLWTLTRDDQLPFGAHDQQQPTRALQRRVVTVPPARRPDRLARAEVGAEQLTLVPLCETKEVSVRGHRRTHIHRQIGILPNLFGAPFAPGGTHPHGGNRLVETAIDHQIAGD